MNALEREGSSVSNLHPKRRLKGADEPAPELRFFAGFHGGHRDTLRPLQRTGWCSCSIRGTLRLSASRDVNEPAADLVNPPHHLAIGDEQQDGAVVDDDLHGAPVVLDA